MKNPVKLAVPTQIKKHSSQLILLAPFVLALISFNSTQARTLSDFNKFISDKAAEKIIDAKNFLESGLVTDTDISNTNSTVKTPGVNSSSALIEARKIMQSQQENTLGLSKFKSERVNILSKRALVAGTYKAQALERKAKIQAWQYEGKKNRESALKKIISDNPNMSAQQVLALENYIRTSDNLIGAANQERIKYLDDMKKFSEENIKTYRAETDNENTRHENKLSEIKATNDLALLEANSLEVLKQNNSKFKSEVEAETELHRKNLKIITDRFQTQQKKLVTDYQKLTQANRQKLLQDLTAAKNRIKSSFKE